MVAWIFALVNRVMDKVKEKAMAAKEFKRGDEVTIRAPHLDGVKAEVLYDMIDDNWVVRLNDTYHPSGHSNEGALYAFPADQLEAVAPEQEVKTPAPADNSVLEVEL